jgi:hypothetical protein
VQVKRITDAMTSDDANLVRTLSRWRHGFEPRWDYWGKRIVGVLVFTLVKVQTRAFGPHEGADLADWAARLSSAFIPQTTSPRHGAGSRMGPSGGAREYSSRTLDWPMQSLAIIAILKAFIWRPTADEDQDSAQNGSSF